MPARAAVKRTVVKRTVVKILGLPVVLAIELIAVPDARGQPADDFYKGRTVRAIVGHPVGNDYDVGTRLLTKYLPKYIPGQPTIIVQNMPQAAGVTAANFLYGVAPRDGSVMGTFTRNYPNMAVMKQPIVEGDPRRFNWLGATSFPGRICVASAKARVRTVAELFSQELIVGGGPGIGSSNSIIPTVINRVVGTKFRIVPGYKGTQDSVLAIERGELEGQCASLGQFRAFERQFKDGTLRILFHAEESPMPDLPGVPSIYDFIKTDEQRQFMRFAFASTEFGRPYVLPPETPGDRVGLLRRAIAAAVKDPDLVAEADRIRLDMMFRPPEQLERLVANLYATPPALIERVKELVPDIR